MAKGTKVVRLEGTHLNDSIEDLNTKEEGVRYIPLMGSAIEIMALLAQQESPLSLGANLLSFAGRMQRMVEIDANTGSYSSARGWWFGKGVTTGDACYRHPDGSGIISLDDAYAREMTSGSPLVNGALDASKFYSAAKKQGIPLTKAQIGKHASQKLQTKDEALNNRVLRILARDPDEVPEKQAIPGLLEAYLTVVFDNNTIFPGEGYVTDDWSHTIVPPPKLTPVYFATVEAVPTMRLWESHAYGNTFHDAVGNISLDQKAYTRMVGVLEK